MRVLLGVTMMAAACVAEAADPVGMLVFPNSDFELGTLENWTQEGDAFKFQPTYLDNVTARREDRRALPQGEYWLGTFEKYQGREGVQRGRHQGDRATGGLISKPFVIKLPVITFLLGGGDKDMEVSLIVNGSTVRTATGANHPMMRRIYWDVSEWEDESGMFYLYDRSTGFFGFLNADDFRYVTEIPDRRLFPNDEPWTEAEGVRKSSSFALSGEAIAFELHGAKGTGLRLLVDGEAVVTEKPRSGEVAKTHVIDVKPWKGKEAVLEVFESSAAGSGEVKAEGFHWAR